MEKSLVIGDETIIFKNGNDVLFHKRCLENQLGHLIVQLSDLSEKNIVDVDANNLKIFLENRLDKINEFINLESEWVSSTTIQEMLPVDIGDIQ
jgi:hypothetical protein